MTKRKKYRWKFNKDPVRVRHVYYETTELDGSHKEVNYWEIATGGDFRKVYITFSNKKFEELFESY
jgi:hypothetical protein